MTTELPHFPYHRDPVASGSVHASEENCECCGQNRGLLYSGNIYTRQQVSSLCPWCIADGSAAKKFGATFFDAYFCNDNLEPVELPQEAYSSVLERTIGFATFNPIGWWVHCGKPAKYVTREEPYNMIFECRHCAKRKIIEDLD